jgi:hypothetical protein
VGKDAVFSSYPITTLDVVVVFCAPELEMHLLHVLKFPLTGGALNCDVNLVGGRLGSPFESLSRFWIHGLVKCANCIIMLTQLQGHFQLDQRIGVLDTP